MLVYVIAILVLLVAALIAFGLGTLLHLHGLAYILFTSLIMLAGIGAAIAILIMHHRSKKAQAEAGSDSAGGNTSELDHVLNDVNRKLRASAQVGKTIDQLPLLYVVGESGAAKTTSILRSSLDPELLAGTTGQDTSPAATQFLNVWFTRPGALIEIGSSVRQSTSLFARLIHRTRATAYRSAFGAGTPARAAIVCLSSDQLLARDGGDSLTASARTTGNQLREISRILGIQVPVYVFVTKLDRVPHFENFVRNLSDEEIRQVCGFPLAQTPTSVGTYADEASRTLAGALDALVFRLGEFRVEDLDRENDPAGVPGVYEFPREFGKLRKALSQYLVELCKPSQLSANPWLRGVYFTGVRARMVERASHVPAAVEVPVAADAGATQFMNLSAMRTQAAAGRQTPVITSVRVPEWTFLPRLLPEVVFGDTTALSPTRQSAPARLFRRILFASLALLFLVGIILVLDSYFNNAALEHRIAAAQQALPPATPQATSLPALTDLKNLDSLRQVILQLQDFHRNGVPWSYRYGLYQGDKLEARARQIYFDHFRPMFLNPAQAGFVGYLRTLPDAPQASSDTGAYLAAYNPLKAYLITTSHPEKSQTKFLTPVFLQYWAASRPVEDQRELAQKQIDFYGDELRSNPPYAIQPDTQLVTHAQMYLSKFLAETRIYQNMLADADKASPSIDFNRQYPDAVRYVSDAHIVRGAFTRTGFDLMQSAIQHPDKYTQGERWVLGDQAAADLNVANISRDLSAQYTKDFVDQWRAFLASARVASCGGPKEAPKQLAALSGPSSPMLELLYVMSHNTAVADPQIKTVFQPAQVMVNPDATTVLIGSGNNKDYISALTKLGLALDLASQNPAITTDANAFAPVSAEVSNSDAAVAQTAQTFSVDQQAHTEKTFIALLKAPVDCVARMAPSPGAAANGGGAALCRGINPLLSKYPFAPHSSVPASVPEVNAVFAPDTGLLWSTYNAGLNKVIVPAGAGYMQAPTAPGPVNPRFLAYFNRAAHISSTMYPANAKSPSLTFNVRFIPGNGVKSATLIIDGQRMPPGSTSQQFTWNAAGAHEASLAYDGQEIQPYQGTWALFQLLQHAEISRSASGTYTVGFPIHGATTVAGRESTASASKAVFELSGPGADVLVGDGLMGLSCAAPVIK
ncbi:MAG TPA: ImcF-related family protein [Acidobacteriaceae bacterium]|nr:ImcF-related family protein [Acidobacteriaceae bacterium]